MSPSPSPPPGLLFTVSAPSGAGKTSLVRALAKQDSNLRVSISHTTRPRRPTEQDGLNYHFIDREKFLRMAEQGGFLEHAQVFGHHYGTSAQEVRCARSEGWDLILEIDWQGAAQVRRKAPETIGIFVAPPSKALLRQRLVDRGEDSMEAIERRLAEARREMSHYREFDYLVINDDFDAALADLCAILAAERIKNAARSGRHRTILNDLLS